MITAQQMRAARALAGIDQKTLAERAGVSLPTIQRMEASDGVVRGVVDTLVKVIRALEESGVELIGDNQAERRRRQGRSPQGARGKRPVRLRRQRRVATATADVCSRRSRRLSTSMRKARHERSDRVGKIGIPADISGTLHAEARHRAARRLRPDAAPAPTPSPG